MSEYRKPLDLHLQKGALHKSLGVAQGKHIPADKLQKALHSDNPLTRKRANFAKVAAGWHHGGR